MGDSIWSKDGTAYLKGEQEEAESHDEDEEDREDL